MAGPTPLIRENCPIATPGNDGLMSSTQAAQLEGLVGGGVGFQYPVPLGAGSDFIIPIPADKQPTNANYIANVALQSVGIFTQIVVPFADQTTTQLRVVTDGVLETGRLLGITITPL